jgi:hypothetical protein
MDGRVQLPVNKYLQKRFNVAYVDSITEAGPVRIISNEWGSDAAQSMVKKVELSIGVHQSIGIAIVCHHDCAGNPIPLTSQFVQLKRSIRYFKNQFNHIEVIGLSVDENWQVHEITS